MPRGWARVSPGPLDTWRCQRAALLCLVFAQTCVGFLEKYKEGTGSIKLPQPVRLIRVTKQLQRYSRTHGSLLLLLSPPPKPIPSRFPSPPQTVPCAGCRWRATYSPGLAHVCWPSWGVGLGGVGVAHPLSSAHSVPSTLRSPSSPIHEEDDSEAPPPPSGAGVALSSSPEVRPLPALLRHAIAICPSIPTLHHSLALARSLVDLGCCDFPQPPFPHLSGGCCWVESSEGRRRSCV